MISVAAPQVFQNGVAMPQQYIVLPVGASTVTKVNMV
jgi:hypothetical protein